MKIRCSMLPAWGDCARRSGAKQYRKEVEGMGFELRKLRPSVGAAIGTAVHHAAALLLEHRRDGVPPDYQASEAIQEGQAQFITEISKGAEWDDTTKNTQDARKQIESLTRAYLPTIEQTTPILIEENFKASIGDGWELTGRIDLYSEEMEIDDLKTGSISRPYIQQAGGYALLLEANGRGVSKVGNTFIKRVRPAKPQPIPIHTEFDMDAAKRSAWGAIKEIRRDVLRFLDSGDPYDLRANPMSLMCSQKYCPAWGTSFCAVHQKPKEK